MNPRIGTCERATAETRVRVRLDLDGRGDAAVRTGIGFLDHLIGALARHARFDVTLEAEGDLQVDDHHVAEDCAIALGRALEQALGDKRGIRRFGSAYAPLDEALARAVVDLSGRPWPEVRLGLVRERLGDLACENVSHFFRSLAIEGRFGLHLDLLRGENDHHRAEAAAKAVALALRAATARDDAPGAQDRVPSTKEALA
jgi:imidazoleglycerol phosphate dehydratase HisB